MSPVPQSSPESSPESSPPNTDGRAIVGLCGQYYLWAVPETVGGIWESELFGIEHRDA